MSKLKILQIKKLYLSGDYNNYSDAKKIFITKVVNAYTSIKRSNAIEFMDLLPDLIIIYKGRIK